MKNRNLYFLLIAFLLLGNVLTTKAQTKNVDLNKGLVLHFDGTISNGKAIDKSGYGNNGTIHGAVTPTIDRFGLANSAYYFNGTDGFITVPHAITLNPGSGSFTISSWIRDKDITKWVVIANKATSDWSDGYRLETNPTNLSFVTSAGSMNGGTIALNSWVMVTAVLDAQNKKIVTYLNGEKVKEVVYNQYNFKSNADLWIGYYNQTSVGKEWYSYFDMDEYRIYNRALDSTEIAALYAFPTVQVSNACLTSTQFTLSHTGVDRVEWNFGDTTSLVQTSGFDKATTHTYTNVGTYVVTEKMYLGGDYAIYTTNVTVKSIYSLVIDSETPILGTDTTVVVDKQTSIDSQMSTDTTSSTTTVVTDTTQTTVANQITTSTTAIDNEAATENSVIIFPNPNKGVFKLKVGANTKSVSVEVSTTLGAVIYTNTYAGQTEISIDLKNPSQGTYVIKVSTDNQTITKKLIVE